HVFLIAVSIAFVFPLVWILISSFTPSGELTANPLRVLPSEATLEHYRTVIVDLGILTNLRNSVLISLASTVITIVLATLAAHRVVRFFPRVGQRLTRILIATYMFPPILLALPYATIMIKLTLINTYTSLILAYLSFSLPYAIWMLVGFYRAVPIEMEEAASVDEIGRAHVSTPVTF